MKHILNFIFKAKYRQQYLADKRAKEQAASDAWAKEFVAALDDYNQTTQELQQAEKELAEVKRQLGEK